MFINTRKVGEEKNIKDKIELDSPQEVLVKRNGRIASYQRFFTPQELKSWVEQELGEGYTVEIANEKNSGTKGLAAVVVTKTKLEDNQGNPIDENGKLILQQVPSIDDITDADFNQPTRNVQLPTIPKNVDAAIGANGKPVIIKKNVFKKNAKSHKELLPSDSRSILNDALYKTNLYGQSQPISRPNYWVAIRTAEKNRVVVLEVNNNKDNVEIIGWRFMGENQLKGLERQAKREDGQLLILTPNNGAAAGLSTLPLGLSTDKVSNTSSPTQENGELFRFEEDAADTADTFTSAAEVIAQQLGVEIEIDESIPAKGSYNPRTGSIRINPSRHATAEDVQRIVLHETIGHGDIQAVAGKRFGQVCQQVHDMMTEEPRSLLCQKHQ